MGVTFTVTEYDRLELNWSNLATLNKMMCQFQPNKLPNGFSNLAQ